MTNLDGMPTITRPSYIFWILFYGGICSSWLLLFVMSGADKGSSFDFIKDLCLSASKASISQLMGMWGLMIGAMMLPSFYNFVVVHQDIRRDNFRHTALLTSGYVTVWLTVVPLAGLTQKYFLDQDLIDLDGRSQSMFLSSLLLFTAGVYQFTKIKNTCLSVCSSPMHFFLSHWKEGYIGSYRMGMHLGMVCVICCWALMLLAFVGGAMNMVWMAGLTSIMVIEKQGYLSKNFSGLVGLTLLGAATITFVLSFVLEVMI
ncbi:MAG: metal-binding protein [Gammaproteobacteria bacterium]|nr:metal-binding protein [Gammaproteobacteria bacterium]